MSVTLGTVSVLVPARRIEETWPGGLKAYRQQSAIRSFESDGELTMAGFDSVQGADAFARNVEKLGLRWEAPYFTDIAIIDEYGSGEDCPWVELSYDENGRAREATLVANELPDPPEAWEG